MNNQTVITTEQGNQYTFFKTIHDTNGNPRYLISWTDLGLPKWAATNATRKAGLRIYKGKAFTGGFIIQSHNLYTTAKLLEEAGLYKPVQPL